MPPKVKEAPKKIIPSVIRPVISDSSFLYIPDDAIEGFQDRIETGINWTLVEDAARYHKQLCLSEDIPTLTFTDALQKKIHNSILNGFLDDESSFTLDQQWELLLPITLWDNEKCANEEGKICFKNINCITDNMTQLIQKAVKIGDRQVLRDDLKKVHVLRVNDTEMTQLDEGLSEYTKLVSLNLCGNYIDQVDASFIPPGLRTLELQANRLRDVDNFAEFLPTDLVYIGLARNLLSNENLEGLGRLPFHLKVLDLSDNDIYHLEPVLDVLVRLRSLESLSLAGNPCSLCAAYGRVTLMRLPRLKWLDNRQVIASDRSEEPIEIHPDDLRSTYFSFNVIRIMSAPPPPKLDKGAISMFHVELELPLLDVTRRMFLMFRNNDSLTEMLPCPEDESESPSKHTSLNVDSKAYEVEESEHEFDIYAHLTAKNSREICHYTTFETNKIPWNKIMNFQEPVLKIFCPDLLPVRDTFRTNVTVRLIYTLTFSGKTGKIDKKSQAAFKQPAEQRVTIATIKCPLRQPDWSQPSQHFHWDESLGTDEAIHWGDGDLSVLQYTPTVPKPIKGKVENEGISTKQVIPENLTCQFSFGIDTLHF